MTNPHYSSALNKARYRVVAKKRRGPDGILSLDDAHVFADEMQDSGEWPPIAMIQHDARWWVFYAKREGL